MKNFLLSTICVLFISSLAYGQATNSNVAKDDEDITFFMAAKAQSFSGTSPNWTGELDTSNPIPNQIPNYQYTLSNIEVGDIIIGGTGVLFEIVNISNITPTNINVTVEKITSNPNSLTSNFPQAPNGIVNIARPIDPVGLLPAYTTNNNGISPIVEAIINNYNINRINNAIQQIEINGENMVIAKDFQDAANKNVPINGIFKIGQGSTIQSKGTIMIRPF